MNTQLLRCLIISCLLTFSISATAADDLEIQVSYEDELVLNTSSVQAPLGCDIWLSRDEQKSWIMIGKTFSQGAIYKYPSRQKGLHEFHFHARKNNNDTTRPAAGAEVHARMLIKELEKFNPNILYSNNRVLSIAYEVMDETRSSDSSFESWLYVTKNSGLTWDLYGVDGDSVSPVEFVTNSDGLFGFKVISADISGQKEAAPSPGVAPEILVRIDTVAPEVAILAPQPYDLWESGTTREVKWQVKDEAIAEEECVTLSYSIGRDDDWVLLADKLPLSGSYTWNIPESENGRVFIRATAVDRSKNYGTSPRVDAFFTRNILEELLSSEVKEQANIYYEAGTICRKNSDFNKAVKYFRLCLQLNPYHIRAHNDMGISLLRLQEHKEAFQHFELGLKYSPSNEKLLLNMAKLYMDHQQYAPTEKLLARLTGLYPKSGEALWLASEYGVVTGQIALARKYWKRLVQTVLPEASIGQKYQQLAKKKLGETSIGAAHSDYKGLVLGGIE
ncbi:MAG: hypothetical protein HQL32_03745 [Planctomycetes bacterium]|nr:hypothetical protein [Planctomycetota bacterium]